MTTTIYTVNQPGAENHGRIVISDLEPVDGFVGILALPVAPVTAGFPSEYNRPVDEVADWFAGQHALVVTAEGIRAAR